MSRFRIDYRVVPLDLRHAFTISRGTKRRVRNVFVRLHHNGITGFGEAAPNTRYGETTERVMEWLEGLPDEVHEFTDNPDRFADRLEQVTRPVCAARAALEMAWLDWWGKSRQEPLWKLLGSESAVGPVTSFTIGLDEIEGMQRKVKEASEYPILKVKLGTDRDREIIKGIREVTDKPIRVDANEGWKTLDQAKEMIGFLADRDIELIEQPMPEGREEDMKQLKAFSPLPLIADESFTGSENLAQVAEGFHGINIKLMKTGSLVTAMRHIDRARELGLQVMVGCMIESSLANTAGAVLALRADYADLDGHLLIQFDPLDGLQLDEAKRIYLSARPGLGVEWNAGAEE